MRRERWRLCGVSRFSSAAEPRPCDVKAIEMRLGYAQDAGRDADVYPQVLLLYGVIAFAVCLGSTSSVGRSLPNAVRQRFSFCSPAAVSLPGSRAPQVTCL